MNNIKKLIINLVVLFCFSTVVFGADIKTEYETLNANGEIVIGTMIDNKKKEERKRTGKIKDKIIEWNAINGEKYISKINTNLQFIPKGYVFNLVSLEDGKEEKKNSSENLSNFGSAGSGISNNLGQIIDTISAIADNTDNTTAGGTTSPIKIYYDPESGQSYIKNADGSITYVSDEVAEQLVANGLGIYYTSTDNNSSLSADSKNGVYYLNEDGELYQLENGEKIYYDPISNENYIKTDSGQIIYQNSEGQAYIRNADGSITYVPNELVDILSGEPATIYYDQNNNPYVLSESGEIVYIPQELADSLVNNGSAIYYTSAESIDDVIDESSFAVTDSTESENTSSTTLTDSDTNTDTNYNASLSDTVDNSSSNSDTVDNSGSNSDTVDNSSYNTQSEATDINTGTTTSTEKVELSNTEILCSLAPDYENETVKTVSRKEISYNDNTKETTDCNIIKTYSLVKDFGECSLRHDYHQKISYKQAEYYYYNSLGEKKNVKGCSDTSTKYAQFEIITDCPAFFDKETLLLYKQKKLYINNEGSIEFVKDCFISTANPLQLSTDDQKIEIQENEEVRFAEKKAYKKYKKYYDINGERYYTTLVLISSQFYTIKKEYETCEYEHRITDNISYKKFRWVYTKDSGENKTVRDCVVDDNLSYGHVTDDKFCSPYYINGALYKKKQTYFRDNNNQIVVVKTCSPSTEELAINSLKIVKNYSCTPDIDYTNNRVNLKYYETYPIANNYVQISDCKSDNKYVPLKTTTEGCEDIVNIDGNVVKTTERYTYNNGEEDKFIGFCNHLASSPKFTVQNDKNKCSLILSTDKKNLHIYSQKYYHDREGVERLVGGCYDTGKTTSIDPYLKQDYASCNVVTNETFTKGYKSYKKIIELPNEIVYTITNCVQSDEEVVLEKEFVNCANEVNTQTGKVLERAKIYYIEDGEKKDLNNTNCSYTGIEYKLEKEYGTCDPREKIVEGEIYPYFAWKYKVGSETVYPLHGCSLEANANSKLIDDFACAGEYKDKIKFDARGNPVVNAGGNPNNLSFTSYEDKKYALIQTKKIYRSVGKWYIAEHCSPRSRFGSATYTEEFIKYNFYDNLKIQRLVNQIVATKNMKGVFADAEKDSGVKYSLGSIPKELKIKIGGVKENLQPVSYTYILTKKYNASALRGVTNTTKTTILLKNCSPFTNGYPAQPSDTTTVTHNADGGTTTVRRTYTTESKTSGRDGCQGEDYNYKRKIIRTTQTTTTHKIIMVEKYYKVDNNGKTVPVYYNIDEYITTENADKDINVLGIVPIDIASNIQ